MNRLPTGIPGYDKSVIGSGLALQARFGGREAILSGNPRLTAAFDRAFVRR